MNAHFKRLAQTGKEDALFTLQEGSGRIQFGRRSAAPPKAGFSILGAAALVLVAAAPAPEPQAEVNRTIFEECPKVFEGRLSLSNPKEAATIGFKSTEPRKTPSGLIPRAERGEGPEKIVIAGHKQEDGRTCSVWFGGPDNARLLKRFKSEARRSGYKVGPPTRLGDGTNIYKLIRSGTAPQTLVIIEADAGGEFGSEPATTVIMMDGD